MEALKDKIIDILICEMLIYGYPVWIGYNNLFDKLKCEYSIHELKKTMKELRNEGRLELRHSIDDDGKINGKGWFLTENKKKWTI